MSERGLKCPYHAAAIMRLSAVSKRPKFLGGTYATSHLWGHKLLLLLKGLENFLELFSNFVASLFNSISKWAIPSNRNRKIRFKSLKRTSPSNIFDDETDNLDGRFWCQYLPADIRIVVGWDNEALDWQDSEVGGGRAGGGRDVGKVGGGHVGVQGGGGGGRHLQGLDRAGHLTTLCIWTKQSLKSLKIELFVVFVFCKLSFSIWHCIEMKRSGNTIKSPFQTFAFFIITFNT